MFENNGTIRRVYLRGPKTGVKRILILLRSTIYEAPFRVQSCQELGGDECLVTHNSSTNTLNVIWANGELTECHPEPKFDEQDDKYQLGLDDIISFYGVYLTEDTNNELQNLIPVGREGRREVRVPSLKSAINKLSFCARYEIANVFNVSTSNMLLTGTD